MPVSLTRTVTFPARHRYWVVLALDGTELNTSVPEFADATQQPSCEALAAGCLRRIARRLPAGVTRTRVRLSEDVTLHADCTELP